MRKIIFSMSIIALVLGMASCKPKNEAQAQNDAIDIHNSMISLDWAGVYTGVIPCADCPGINVRVLLDEDCTYHLSYEYIDRDSDPFTVSGEFSWDDSGNSIVLDTPDFPPYYQVGENRLIQLDMNGDPITGDLADMYVLTKEI